MTYQENQKDSHCRVKQLLLVDHQQTAHNEINKLHQKAVHIYYTLQILPL